MTRGVWLRYRVAFPPELLRLEHIGPTAKFLYLVAEAIQPRSVVELARIAGVDPRHTARTSSLIAGRQSTWHAAMVHESSGILATDSSGGRRPTSGSSEAAAN